MEGKLDDDLFSLESSDISCTDFLDFANEKPSNYHDLSLNTETRALFWILGFAAAKNMPSLSNGTSIYYNYVPLFVWVVIITFFLAIDISQVTSLPAPKSKEYVELERWLFAQMASIVEGEQYDKVPNHPHNIWYLIY